MLFRSMATHSSVLAWRIPGTGEPGGLPSMGRTESDTTEATQQQQQQTASLVAQTVKGLPTMQETRVRFLGGEIPWRRQWQPTPVLLPGKSHGWRSLVGYSPWGCKESDTTERLHFHFHFEVAQSCPTLCDPMDYSLPGSSIHGIFQARILEWVAIDRKSTRLNSSHRHTSRMPSSA